MAEVKVKRPRGRPRKVKRLPLSAKQEAYCRCRIEKQLSKTKSYEMAYGNTSYPYIYAYELEKKPHIQQRLKELREERAVMAKFYGGPEEALARWNEIYQLAMMKGDLKEASKAQENMDKITGADKAALMHDEAAKQMFLSLNASEGVDDFKSQIASMLAKLEQPKHRPKQKMAFGKPVKGYIDETLSETGAPEMLAVSTEEDLARIWEEGQRKADEEELKELLAEDVIDNPPE